MSDGTLRLIGLTWSLLENKSVLLLEEPEESLHSEIVSILTWLLYAGQMRQRKRKQIFAATHSPALLSDEGIDAGEILELIPPDHSGGGTKVRSVEDWPDIQFWLDMGDPVGPVAVQHTAPKSDLHLTAEFRD